jgi:hypothetical protein
MQVMFEGFIFAASTVVTVLASVGSRIYDRVDRLGAKDLLAGFICVFLSQ